MDWTPLVNTGAAVAQGIGSLWSIFSKQTLPDVVIKAIKGWKSVSIKRPIFVAWLLLTITLLVITSLLITRPPIISSSSDKQTSTPTKPSSVASTKTADTRTPTEQPIQTSQIETFTLNKHLSCNPCSLVAPDIWLTSISLDKINHQTLFYLKVKMSSNVSLGDEFQITIFTLTGSNDTPKLGKVDWGGRSLTADGNLAVGTNDELQVTEKFSSFTLSQGRYMLDVSTSLLTSYNFVDNFDPIQFEYDGSTVKASG